MIDNTFELGQMNQKEETIKENTIRYRENLEKIWNIKMKDVEVNNQTIAEQILGLSDTDIERLIGE